MKRIIIYSTAIAFSLSAYACTPNTGTQDQKDTVQGDTLDVNQGKGEGEVGEGVIGG